jgi:hypothetical protein
VQPASGQSEKFFNELRFFQIDLSRKLYNTSLLFQDIQPSLVDLEKKYEQSNADSDIVYRVPHIKKRAFALIRNEQRKEFLREFSERGFFDSTLIACIAFFEGWLEEWLRRIYSQFPSKIDDFSNTSLSKYLSRGKQSGLNTERVLEIILGRFSHLSAAEQAKVLECLKLARNKDSVFDEYIEISQARNLLVHKNGVIDQKYVFLAGDFGRGKAGAKIPMDLHYFMRAIAIIKEYTEIIRFCTIDYLSHSGPSPYVLDDPPYQFVQDYQVRT